MWSCLYFFCLDCYIQQIALKFFHYRFDFSTVISAQYSSSINNVNQDWSCASFLILLVSVLYIYWNARNFFCKCVWNILNRNTVLSLIFYILDRFYIGGHTMELLFGALLYKLEGRSFDFRWCFLLNNQTDALIIKIYSVIKRYMFRGSSLPIIRSSLLYIRHW